MKRLSLYLLVGVVALLAFSIPVLAVATGEPNLSVTVTDDRLAPGESTALEVAVQNRGELTRSSQPDLDDRVLTARGVTVEVDERRAPLDVRTGEQSIGSLRDGDRTTVPFTVVVAEDAEPGTYRMDVDVEYRYTSYYDPSERIVQERTVDRTRRIEIEIIDESRFEITDVTADVAVGDSGPVTMNVTNTGTERAESSVVTVESDNPAVTFDEQPEAREFVGDWDVDETRTITTEATVAPDAEPRNYSLGATVNYDDADGLPAESDRLAFGVQPRPEQTFDLENVTSTLRVGEDGTLEGELVNTGDAPVRNVVLAFQPESPNVNVVEPEYAIGDLDVGERATFDFEVEVSRNANPGPRQYTLEPRYRNVASDRRFADELDAHVAVGERRDAFVVEGVDATFEAGESGPLEVAVTNNRDETVTDISAKLFVSSPVSVDDDEAFISELDPGETTTVVFEIGVGSGALAKTYAVETDFRYRTADGDTRISDTYNVPIQVTRPADDGISPVMIVVGLLVLALVLGGAYVYRRREGGD